MLAHSIFKSKKIYKKFLLLSFVFAFGLFQSVSGQVFPFPTDIPSVLPQYRNNTTQVASPLNAIDGSRTDISDPKEKAKQDSAKKAQEEELKADKVKTAFRKKIFGYNIFNNPNIQFNPPTNMATPHGYVLGPGDQVNVYISGYAEKNYQLRITPDGFVNIDRGVGNVHLAGLTIEDARQKLKERLSKIYVGLNGGSVRMEAYLGNLRNIRITVQGEVIAPGTYTVSSLATVLNALYLSGGPNENGSYRNIRVIRNNRVAATLDLYDYLTSGIQKDDIRLQDNDNIKVSLYENRLEFTGRVKRPGIYEFLPTERLDKVLRYAGGFSQGAFSNMLKITRFTDKQIKVLDISSDIFSSFAPNNGDIVDIESVLLTRFENQVTIEGAVFRPGKYSVNESATLSRLIERAEGLREDAFTGRILISRTRDDLTKENISANFADIQSGKSPDIALRREDIITVPSAVKLKEEYQVRIFGEVNLDTTHASGIFPYAKGMTVEDLIVRAGGLLESASASKIEVARRKKSANGFDPATISPAIAELYTFDIGKDLRLDANSSKFTLEPFDEVTVYKSPIYEKQQVVTIEGQVIRSGKYAIQSKDERISAVIARAGGVNSFAYLAGSSLTRTVMLSKIELENRKKAIDNASTSTKDTQVKTTAIDENSQERIGVDIAVALAKPGGPQDLVLQDGDIITIPKFIETIRIQGEVLYPTSTKFEEGASLKHYIAEAGGFTSKSKRSTCFVVYANGSADRTRHFLFFKIYPKVKPGAEIIVPAKSKSDVTPQEIAGIVSTVTGTLATLFGLVALIRTLK